MSSANDYGNFNDHPEVLDERYVRFLIDRCTEERIAGTHPHEVEEGDRLASEFRRLFPDVSDTDLGTFLVILTRVVGLLSRQGLMNAAQAMDLTITSYSHAAAVILKSVIDLKEL